MIEKHYQPWTDDLRAWSQLYWRSSASRIFFPNPWNLRTKKCLYDVVTKTFTETPSLRLGGNKFNLRGSQAKVLLFPVQAWINGRVGWGTVLYEMCGSICCSNPLGNKGAAMRLVSQCCYKLELSYAIICSDQISSPHGDMTHENLPNPLFKVSQKNIRKQM